MDEIISWIAEHFVALIGILGAGSLLTAIYTATATEKRDRKAWQREHQVKAYECFRDALLESYLRVAGGEVEKGSRETSEQLNDVTVAENSIDIQRLSRATLEVMSFGEEKFANYAAKLSSAWEQWLYESTPLSGAQSHAATFQKKWALGKMGEALVDTSLRVRLSLGTLDSYQRRRLKRKPHPMYRIDHPLAAINGIIPHEKTVNEHSLARAKLIKWRVRDCHGNIPSIEAGYTSNSYPWAQLNVDHANYFHPIAALALKRPFCPWQLSIESRLGGTVIAQLELDAVRLITGNTGAWPLKLSGGNWVPGEEEGDRAFIWLIQDIEERGIKVHDAE